MAIWLGSHSTSGLSSQAAVERVVASSERLGNRARERVATQGSRARSEERIATHGAVRQTGGIVGVSAVVAELVGLHALLEDGHVERPRLAGPHGPDRVVLVLEARVRVQDHRELAAVLQHPRHDEAVVADGNEDRPLARHERAADERRVGQVVVGDQTQVAVIVAAIAVGSQKVLEGLALCVCVA